MNHQASARIMLAATSCPCCGAGELELHSTCMSGGDSYRAACTACQAEVTVSRAHDHSGQEQPCRVCGSGQLSGVMHCETESHQRHLVMQCDYCAATSIHLSAA
ncbi:MAG: hypothetical protein OEY97_04265 [Nitrospirota bacterium]|nr:hypothetical protein [Nitrospirota bacterium]